MSKSWQARQRRRRRTIPESRTNRNLQESAQGFWREHVKVHPDKGDDREDGEHANNNAGGAFGPVGGCVV
jgi:hypothetical protein